MVISTIQSVSHTQNLKNDLCYNFIPAPGTLTAGQKAPKSLCPKSCGSNLANPCWPPKFHFVGFVLSWSKSEKQGSSPMVTQSLSDAHQSVSVDRKCQRGAPYRI